MENKVMTPVTKGLIISLALIVYSVVVILTKQETNKSLGFFSYAVLLGGSMWACFSYSSQLNGNVTFGQLFSHGFKTTALVAALVTLWFVLSIKVIFPEVFDRMIEAQRLELIKRGMSDGDIDNAMSMGRKIAVPMGALISVIFHLIIGAIGSLIGAALAKKNPNPVFPENAGL